MERSPTLIKRDLKASQKSIDDLRKQLLYQEHYSRRENLMFMGIAEKKKCVFEDIPKELYKLRKSQSKNFKVHLTAKICFR